MAKAILEVLAPCENGVNCPNPGEGKPLVPLGISKLSELEIDVHKDWGAYRIENLGAPTASGHALRRGDDSLINHDALLNFVAAKHLTLPSTIANVLTNHNLANHPLSIIPTMDDAHIPSLDASKITSGVFADARIPKIYGWHGSKTRIKITSTEFMSDDDAFPVIHASAYGRCSSGTTGYILVAVAIPSGYKATHVMIYASEARPVTVYETTINGITLTSKGTGNSNTEIDITDVTSNTTNYLLIRYDNTVGDYIYGGYVTIEEA